MELNKVISRSSSWNRKATLAAPGELTEEVSWGMKIRASEIVVPLLSIYKTN